MLYAMQAGAAGRIKLGRAQFPEGRLAALQTGNSRRLRLLAVTPGGALEASALHERFADARVGGEWFRPTPQLKSAIEAWGPMPAMSATVEVYPSGKVEIVVPGRSADRSDFVDLDDIASGADSDEALAQSVPASMAGGGAEAGTDEVKEGRALAILICALAGKTAAVAWIMEHWPIRDDAPGGPAM